MTKSTELHTYDIQIKTHEELDSEDRQGYACSMRINGKLCPCGADYMINNYPICEDCEQEIQKYQLCTDTTYKNLNKNK